VLCCACRTARRDKLATTSETRVQVRRHSVDRGGTCPPHFFQKLFLRLIQIQNTKDKNCTRELYCFFVVRAIRACRVMTQQVEFGLVVFDGKLGEFPLPTRLLGTSPLGTPLQYPSLRQFSLIPTYFLTRWLNSAGIWPGRNSETGECIIPVVIYRKCA